MERRHISARLIQAASGLGARSRRPGIQVGYLERQACLVLARHFEGLLLPSPGWSQRHGSLRVHADDVVRIGHVVLSYK